MSSDVIAKAMVKAGMIKLKPVEKITPAVMLAYLQRLVKPKPR